MLERIETDDGGHYYTYDGKRVPAISEILEAADVHLKNSFYEARKDAASVRGSDVHMACADLDNSLPGWWDYDEAVNIRPYIAAYQLFKADFSFKPTLIEKPLFHEFYRYAGTPDRFGTVELKNSELGPVTVELKCTSTIYPHVFLQLAGQNFLSDDYEERRTVAVQLKPNGKYSLHWDKDQKASLQVFLSCLTLYTWKQQNIKRPKGETIETRR